MQVVMTRAAALSQPAEGAGSEVTSGLGSFKGRVSWRKLAGGKELWALIDQGLVSGSNFISFVLLARMLGMQEFGVFTLAWMAVLLASNLQMALIVSPMMSIGPKETMRMSPLYYGAVTAQALILAAFSALCVYASTIVSSVWFPSWNVHTLALPLAVATGAYLLQDYTRRYFFTIRRSGLALTSDAISYLTQLPVLLWLALHHELSSASALWAIALTSLLAAFISTVWMRSLCFNARMVRTVAQRHWPVARWLFFSASLQWSSQNLFVVSAPLFYGPASAGVLRACQNIVALAHIWILGLENVLPVEAARRLHREGTRSLLRYVRSTALRWGFITATYMLIIGLFPSFWLHLVYGSHYSAYGQILRLNGVLYVVISLGGSLRAGLQALEFTAPILWSYCVMTVFALLASVPLAKHLGLPGVMIGLIAAQLICQAILVGALVVKSRRTGKEEHLMVRDLAPPIQ